MFFIVAVKHLPQVGDRVLVDYLFERFDMILSAGFVHLFPDVIHEIPP